MVEVCIMTRRRGDRLGWTRPTQEVADIFSVKRVVMVLSAVEVRDWGTIK